MAKRMYGGADAVSDQNIIIRPVVIDESEVHDRTKRNNKTKRIISVSFAAILLGTALFFGIKAYLGYKERADAEKLWDGVHDIAIDDEDPDPDEAPAHHYVDPDNLEDEVIYKDHKRDENMYRQYDVAALQAINPDVSYWMYVPETYIDYPVMKEPVYGQYKYLYSDMYGKYSVYGSLFEAADPDDFDESIEAHKVVYGHCMTDATMMSTLGYYKSKDFYKSSPYIYLYYPDRTERWEIWAAAHVDEHDSIYELPLRIGSDTYGDILSDFYSKRFYDTDCDKNVSKYMRTMAFSTCDWVYGNRSGRMVVVCVRDKVLVWDE